MVRFTNIMGGVALICTIGAVAQPVNTEDIKQLSSRNQDTADVEKRLFKFNFKRDEETADKESTDEEHDVEKRLFKFNFKRNEEAADEHDVEKRLFKFNFKRGEEIAEKENTEEHDVEKRLFKFNF
ncbi:hypothetical protein LZ32DRAFT_667032 [Colletotrichum eremochloae]|nr:hypothetical protein LZ32DRAFT_667032 [Colletotrichum eremochloae]